VLIGTKAGSHPPYRESPRIFSFTRFCLQNKELYRQIQYTQFSQGCGSSMSFFEYEENLLLLGVILFIRTTFIMIRAVALDWGLLPRFIILSHIFFRDDSLNWSGNMDDLWPNIILFQPTAPFVLNKALNALGGEQYGSIPDAQGRLPAVGLEIRSRHQSMHVLRCSENSQDSG